MNVSVIGSTGYTGNELVKIMAKHPYLEISCLTSDNYAGQKYSDIYPPLKNIVGTEIISNDWDYVSDKSDIVFLCLPHAASQKAAAFFHSKGKLVVDLSADFRIKSKEIYEKTYNVIHNYPDLLAEAAYGLPEIYGNEIKQSRLIANPGCYPTSVLLAVYPLVKNKFVDEKYIIADCKSGVSGAGKKLTEKTQFCEVSDDFKPYGIFSHRHGPEINAWLSEISADIRVIFTPHLLPMIRGIESTIYCKSDKNEDEIRQYLKEFYRDSFFVRIMEKGVTPRIANVSGTNFADIGVFKEEDDLIIVSCIDNLLKGASGQAVQNVNIAMDFDEETGLI
ncbi:N-acetyl-gamma-glutamyl-phosphate reductase [Flexistipes sp.]|uniref:N-acetyl-gamma-glutamyl-phosphate reductase n=1 Tax=Flexistipes sp. TaxID=3088135 RepID=UPI002E2247D4|nr:N-acetyl-gamma-glutamyl-phosphate reductase [Flexistipes sp.]